MKHLHKLLLKTTDDLDKHTLLTKHNQLVHLVDYLCDVRGMSAIAVEKVMEGRNAFEKKEETY